MTVTPRGKSFQACLYQGDERYRRSFATRQEAELWEAESKVRLLQGLAPVMGEAARARSGVPHTVTELIEHVYETHWQTKSSGVLQRFNALEVASLIGKQTPIAKVTKLALDKAKAQLLAKGNAQGTVNRKLAAMSKAMQVAVDMELINRAPKVEKFSESEGRQRRFTPTEEKQAIAFFEHIGQSAMADYVALSIDTGMRQGELLTLTFEAVTKDTIQVSGEFAKSGKNRTVPLTKRAQEVIERRRKEIDAGPKNRVLGLLNKRAIHHYWCRLKESLELSTDKQFTPHLMRHEFLSRLADLGLNAAVLQQLAGHASMVTTQRYIHVSGRELVSAIARLEKAPTRELEDA